MDAKGALRRIAFFRGIRSELPNQELARELALSRDRQGIQEIVQGLGDPNRSLASDCIKVLYEIGHIDPGLIVEYGERFVDLLGSGNNRMVWGGMIALSTIAEEAKGLIWKHRDRIVAAIEGGSVITEVSGIRTIVKANVGVIKKSQAARIHRVLKRHGCNAEQGA
jgi:hypothetical protein